MRNNDDSIDFWHFFLGWSKDTADTSCWNLEVLLSLMSKIGGDYRCPRQRLQDGNCWKYCFLIFDPQFGYPIFEGIFTLIPSSNGSMGYMVGKLILRSF
jgi:hypothetical protein